MKKDPFDFNTWIRESVSLASLEVIKKAMAVLAKEGSSSDHLSNFKHSFYVSLVTKDKDVVMPDFLKSQYPEAITIVLESQFENLIVSKEGFSVRLSFSGKPEDLYIPFKSIINFTDKELNLNIPLIYDEKRLLKEDYKAKKSDKEKKSNKKVSKNKPKISNVINFNRDDYILDGEDE